MALSISAVVLLAIVVFLLVRKSGLKAGHAVVCMLLGFYLASSLHRPHDQPSHQQRGRDDRRDQVLRQPPGTDPGRRRAAPSAAAARAS